MSPQGALTIVSATVGALVGLLTLGLSRAPGCRSLRWLGLIAASAGAAAALRGESAAVSDSALLLMTRMGVSLSGVLLYAWLKYETSDRPATRGGRLVAVMALAFSAVSLLPGVVIAQAIVRHGDGWSNDTYVDVTPTAFGAAGLLGVIAAATTLLVRYVGRWQAGDPGARAHAIGLLGLQAAALHDTVDGAWVHRSMHLLPVGLLWTIGAIGVALVGRFVDGARSLSELSTRLEHAVEERSAELAKARASLLETEQLATLGRLSAALAHEVNNPLATVAANLEYLRDTPAVLAKSAERLDALADATQSVERVAAIVRQLGDAGEVAIHGEALAPAPLASVVHAAVEAAKQRMGNALRVSVDVPRTLHVAALEASLQHVVASLVAGAVEAMRAIDLDGSIRIRAEQQRDRVLLRISDESPEQDDLLRERRFKRFFDERPGAVRDDVGLSVSLALLRMLGAKIELERSDDDGSTMRIDLRAAEAPARSSSAPASSTGARARVLIVDDELLTRIALRRLLGREYDIVEAAGVEEALTCVRERRGAIDAIISDLVMPDGGAQRLLEELEKDAPELGSATLLLTGGAVDGQTGSFLASRADRVLRKPVDVSTLRAFIERFRVRRRDVSRSKRDR